MLLNCSFERESWQMVQLISKRAHLTVQLYARTGKLFILLVNTSNCGLN